MLYESVHRIEKLLKELIGLMPERKMCVLREMTKIFESHICGTPAEVLKGLEASQIKGEFVIVMEGKRD